MRLDSRNWKLGILYHCRRDPRLVVRNRDFIGWAWNFGNPWVGPAILLAVMTFLLPASIAVIQGITSLVVISTLLFTSLVLIVAWAHHNSRNPAQRGYDEP